MHNPEDDVLRRMLSTPPKPHNKPQESTRRSVTTDPSESRNTSSKPSR